MNAAFKFRLYPTSDQCIMFAKTFGCTRAIYNMMLKDKMDYYAETKQALHNTPAQYKSKYEWLKEVDCMALCNAQMNLESAFRNFFERPSVGFPKLKSKKSGKHSYTTNCIKNNIRLENGKIRLPKAGWVKIVQHRPIPSGYVLKSVTVHKTPSGKYYASILYEYESDVPTVEIKNVIGLDFSMKELYVDSSGNSPQYPRFYRQMETKLDRERRKLSHCVQHSQNWYKQKHRVALLSERVANQRKDFLHKQSRQITNAYDAVCIENLNMHDMAQSLNFGKSVSDNGWGMFTNFLKYKLECQGKKLVKIDKWYPSTKTCSRCGKVKDEMALSQRVYVCECGNVLDRDHNAAINIKNEGLRLLIA